MTGTLLDEILQEGHGIRRLGPGLFSAMSEPAAAAYDGRAALYDAVVGRSLYNRVFWGTSPRALRDFSRTAIDAADGHWLAESGCGSLLFTHSWHRNAHGPPTLLADRSLRMLQRGAARLGMGGPHPPRNIAMLHADAADLPVRSGVFRSILSLNLLHVPCDTVAIVRELGRLLQPVHGRLFLSCLVRSGRWSDAYMRLLYRAGELKEPWLAEDLARTAAGGWGVVESTRMEGNMCYVVIRHTGADSTH